MEYKDTRDGNWLDEWGSCRVCGGEIPYGHTDNCDIFKSEKKIRELEQSRESYIELAAGECEDKNEAHQRIRELESDNLRLSNLSKDLGIQLTAFNSYVSSLVGRENEGKRIDVLIEYVKNLQAENSRLKTNLGEDTSWPNTSLLKALVIAEARLKDTSRDFDGWESIQQAAAVAQWRLNVIDDNGRGNTQVSWAPKDPKFKEAIANSLKDK